MRNLYVLIFSVSLQLLTLPRMQALRTVTEYVESVGKLLKTGYLLVQITRFRTALSLKKLLFFPNQICFDINRDFNYLNVGTNHSLVAIVESAC